MTDTLRFTSFDQIKSGVHWTSARLQALAQYERLWANAPRQAPKEFEQHIKAGGAWVQLSPYRRITSFWVDGLWGRPPAGVPEDVVDVMARATRHRSVGGYGIVAVEGGGRLRVIPPASWHPVIDPRDGDNVLGHIVSWLWASGDDPDQYGAVPDRIDLLLFSIEGSVNVRQTWELSGFQLGQLLEEQPAGLERVVVWGDGRSDYLDVESLVNELEYRLNFTKRLIDWHGNPALVGPPLAGSKSQPTQPERDAYEADQLEPKFDQRRQGVGGGYLAIEGDQVVPSYLTLDTKLPDSVQLMNFLVDQITTTTGIPTGSLGVADQAAQMGGTDGQSGVSRERQLFAAVARLRNLRRECESAVELLAGMADIDWPPESFSSWSEMTGPVLDLLNAKLIDPASAADLLGITYTGTTQQVSGQ